MRSWFCYLFILLIVGPARAQVIAVPFEGSLPPTETFMWQARDAKAVLVMIPGGDGRLGLRPTRADLGGFYGKTLKPLADTTLTSGRIDVAVFDSPYPLPVSGSYLMSRATTDHLGRIASVVSFYASRFGKPVWLMGHSNGSISVAEFLRGHEALLAGAIFSASRDGVRVSPKTVIPILFLHHRKDSCVVASGRDDLATFEALRAAGKANTAFIWLEGGSSEHGNPCGSGYHLYSGAEAEAYRAIEAFIASH